MMMMVIMSRDPGQGPRGPMVLGIKKIEALSQYIIF